MEVRKEPWLVNALQMELSDPDKLRRYRQISREKISQNSTSRVFDHFDVLTPDQDLLQLTKEYLRLLSSITAFTTANGDIANLSEPQETVASGLLTKIIRYGIAELFDESHCLRQELVGLLNWHDLTADIHPVDILCAYVGGVFQQMYAKYPKSLDEYLDARQCTDKYINQHYKKMVFALLRENGFNIEASPNLFNDLITTAKNNMGLIATTVAVTAALASFGVYAFNALKNKDKKPEREAKNTAHR